MNDAISSDGTSSGGKSNESRLKDVAEDLREAAAKAWVKELEGDHRVSILDTSTGANMAATEQAEGVWDLVETADGRFYVGDKADMAADPNAFMWVYWARDSKAWQDVIESFEYVKQDIEWFAALDPAAFNVPIAAMQSVIDGLDQGGIQGSSEDVVDKAEAAAAGEGVDVAAIFTPESEWVGMNEVSSDLDEWDGYAVDVFKMAYANRLPVILIGQLALAITLRGTLEVAQKAIDGAQNDAIELAQANIDALEGAGSGADINWTKVLETISAVSLTVEKATSLIPHPGAQGFSKVAGYVSKGSGLAAMVVGQFEKNAGTSEPTVSISGGTVQAMLDHCSKQTTKIQGTLDDLERAAADVVDAFYELATSTDTGAVVEPDWGKVTLTMREAFFEPKAPSAAKGYGPGLADIGSDLTDSDDKNDPTFETLRDSNVMGPAPQRGASFGGDLNSLYRTGTTVLPGLASQYSGLAGSLGGADAGVSRGFTREVQIAGGAQMGDGTGPLYPSWQRLHAELLNIFDGSATNLEQVGATLAFAAQAFADEDQAAADEIRSMHDGKLPWE